MFSYFMEISLPTKWGKCLYMCAQSCPVLGYPMDHRPPGSVVYGIFQAKILPWVRSSPPRDQTCISCIGKWILYCCAKSKPICPVLAIARIQLPSLEFGRDSKAGKTWESFIVKKRKVFTKIGGCWNNGKCTISFSPNFFPPWVESKRKNITSGSYWSSPECSEHAVAEVVICLPGFLGEHSIVLDHLDLAYLYLHSLTVVMNML